MSGSSSGARKGWETRRADLAAAEAARFLRSESARKGWETRRANEAAELRQRFTGGGGEIFDEWIIEDPVTDTP